MELGDKVILGRYESHKARSQSNETKTPPTFTKLFPHFKNGFQIEFHRVEHRDAHSFVSGCGGIGDSSFLDSGINIGLAALWQLTVLLSPSCGVAGGIELSAMRRLSIKLDIMPCSFSESVFALGLTGLILCEVNNPLPQT